MIGLNYYLIVLGLFFCIGLVGMLKCKNILLFFFFIEIMFNVINIGFVVIFKYMYNLDG